MNCTTGLELRRVLVVAASFISSVATTAIAQGTPAPIVSIRETAASLARSGAASGDARAVLAAAQALAQSRGAAGGPIWADGFIGANAAAEYKVSFQGGYAPNKIDVSASSGTADLDCYLYEGKQLVARDNGFGGDCNIKWSQKLSGTMTLAPSCYPSSDECAAYRLHDSPCLQLTQRPLADRAGPCVARRVSQRAGIRG